MAKYTNHLKGDFGQIVDFIDLHVRQQSMTISEEESYKTVAGDKRDEQRVYERFSAAGSNRASLSVLFVETEDGADVCGIATGGSQALVFKINTLGEHAFPDTPVKAADLWNSNAVGLSG